MAQKFNSLPEVIQPASGVTSGLLPLGRGVNHWAMPAPGLQAASVLRSPQAVPGPREPASPGCKHCPLRQFPDEPDLPNVTTARV